MTRRQRLNWRSVRRTTRRRRAMLEARGAFVLGWADAPEFAPPGTMTCLRPPRRFIAGGTHAAMLHRLVCADGRTLILKWFTEEETAAEVNAYALLARYCVPVLPLLGHTERALLLEDLTSNDNWRLARDRRMSESRRWREAVRKRTRIETSPQGFYS